MSRPVGLKAITPGMGVAAPAGMGVALDDVSGAEAKVCGAGSGLSLQTRLRKHAENGEVASQLVAKSNNATKCIKLNKMSHVNNSCSLVSHNSTQCVPANQVNNRVTSEKLLPCKQSVSNVSSTETMTATRTLPSTTKCGSSPPSSVNSPHEAPVSPDHKHKRIKLIRSPINVQLTNSDNIGEVMQSESAGDKSSTKLEKGTPESKCQAVKLSPKDDNFGNSNPKTLTLSITKLKSDPSQLPNKPIKKTQTSNNGQVPKSLPSDNNIFNAKALRGNSTTSVAATIITPSDGSLTSEGKVTKSRNCPLGSSKNVRNVGVAAVASLKKSELVDGRDSVRITGKCSVIDAKGNISDKSDLVETNSSAMSKECDNLKDVLPRTDRKTRQINCYPNTTGESRTTVNISSVSNSKTRSVADSVCRENVNKCTVNSSSITDQPRLGSEVNPDLSLKYTTSRISQTKSKSSEGVNNMNPNVCMNTNFVKQSNALLIQKPSLDIDKSSTSSLISHPSNVTNTVATRKDVDDAQTTSVSSSKSRPSNTNAPNKINMLDHLRNKKLDECSTNPDNLKLSEEKSTHPVCVPRCAFPRVPSSSDADCPPKSSSGVCSAYKSTAAAASAPKRKVNVNNCLTTASGTTSAVVTQSTASSTNVSVHSTTQPSATSERVVKHSCSSEGLVKPASAASSIVKHSPVNSATSAALNSLFKTNCFKDEGSGKCPQSAPKASSSSSSSSQTSESDDSFESARSDSFDGAFCGELLQAQQLQGEFGDEEEEEEDETEATLRSRVHPVLDERGLHLLEKGNYIQQEEQDEEEEDHNAGDVPHKPIFETEEEMTKQRRRSNLKRKRSEEPEPPPDSEPSTALDATTCVAVPSAKRPRRGIKFDGVTVFYFPRSQGFSCVPSQGGSTLGMARRHFHIRKFSITDHLVEQRRMHKLQRLKRLAEEESGGDLSSNCYLNRKPLSVESSCTSSLYPSPSFMVPQATASGNMACLVTSDTATTITGQHIKCASLVTSNGGHASTSVSHALGSVDHTTSNAVTSANHNTSSVSHAISNASHATSSANYATSSASHTTSSTSHATSTASLATSTAGLATSSASHATSSTNGVVALSFGLASSDDDTEEDGSELSESEIDNDFCFLQPLAIRQRRSLLRESGIKAIESVEKEECKDIRISREMCGCQCKLYCFPDTCQCIEAGIKCQVDRHNFPCGCSVQGCGNPHGRIEFNPIRVRTHFLHTLMRLEIEKRQAEQRAVFQQQQRSRWEEQRSRWLACLGSPLPALPPCPPAPEADGPHQPGADGALDGR